MPLDFVPKSKGIPDKTKRGDQFGQMVYVHYRSVNHGLIDEPFGLESRHEKYGSSEEVAWYYFTGKPKDDESGLLFFGARYYDPTVGRFITADTIVPYPSDPQSFNRYSYARNNPVNIIDPTGHKWSWTKFWHAAVGVLVGIAAAIVAGPAGFGITSAWVLGAIGGSVAGAVSGGLDGGWKGALIGGALGGVLGGIGGWAGGLHSFTGNMILGGMAVGGIGYAAATGSWDSFAGGLAGAVAGNMIGNGITSAFKEQFSNFRARKSPWSEYSKQIDELYAQNKDNHNASALKVSRPLARADGSPGSLTGPRHDLLVLPNGSIKEMGPLDNGNIGINPWRTAITSDKALDLGGAYTRNIYADVNLEGLNKAMSIYDKTIVQTQTNYNPVDHNSNYAVDSWIRGGGGDVPKGYRDPGFPNID